MTRPRTPLRSLLVALGIPIGVAAMVVAASVGRGAQLDAQSRLDGLGSSLLSVLPGLSRTGFWQGGPDPSGTLTIEDAQAIRDQIMDLAGVAPQLSVRGEVSTRRSRRWTMVTGTVPDFPRVRGWQVARGSFFTDADVEAGLEVCVLGHAVATALFAGEDPLDRTVRIKSGSFRVAGVMSPRNAGSQDDVVFVPITTAIGELTGRRQVQLIFVNVASEPLMEKTRGEVEWLLRDRHQIAQGGQDDFVVMSRDDVLSGLGGLLFSPTPLVAAAAVLLLAGGIGIRGIVRASAAQRGPVLHAVVLSTSGGLCGWALGAAAGPFVAAATHMSAVVPAATPALAIGLSVAIGIICGATAAPRARRPRRGG